MNTRRRASYLTLIAVVPAVVLALASCGRSVAPTTVEGDRLDRSAAPLAPLAGGSGEFAGYAVVVLKAEANQKKFENKNKVDELERTTIGGTTFLLVASTVDEPNLVEKLTTEPEVALVFGLGATWGPGGTGEPMSFDDGGPKPTSADYRNQSVLARVRQPEATMISKGGGTTIAILDTGIDPTHPVFIEDDVQFVFGSDWTLWPRSNSVEEKRNGRDDDRDGRVDEGYGHGTHVAGIAHLAALGARLAIIKVLNDDGSGTTFGLASGIMEAIHLQADVINLSLGLLYDDPMVAAAIVEAERQGVAVIASAGNRGTNVPQFPAAYDFVMCIAAVDVNDVFWENSNNGRSVDMTAPGVGVVSLLPPDHELGAYAAGQGTSFSAPFVTGATAMVLSHMPWLSSREAALRVRDNAENIDEFNLAILLLGSLGSGRIDMAAPLAP